MSDEEDYQDDFEDYISDDDYQINYKNFISKFPIPTSQKLDFFSEKTDEMRNILYDNEEKKYSKNIFLHKKKSKPQPQNSLTTRFEDDLSNTDTNSVSFLSEPIHKKKEKRDFLDITPPFLLSSFAWIIMNGKTMDLITGKNINKKRQIASLTKIMTAYVVLNLLEQMKISPKTTFLQVSKKAASIQGTSADLEEGDVLSIWDLLHGLMLPSGNDAAYSLAENFGVYIYYSSAEGKKLQENKNFSMMPKKFINFFIDEMNLTAKKIKMGNTFFANGHGLPNADSYSTSYDMAVLSFYVMKNEKLRQIVKTKTYEFEYKDFEGNSQIKIFENSNKMLELPDYIGLKTGFTEPAGGCLSAVFKKEDSEIIVVVLGAKGREERFNEVKRLVDWIEKKTKDPAE